MRLNREKTAALLAGAVLLLGLVSVVRGFTKPVQAVQVPDMRLTESTRKILYRKYRTFTEEVDVGRNPFSFSEGWQRMETTPMALPPLPPPSRVVPLLWPGATASEAGLQWIDNPVKDTGEKPEANG